MVSSTMQPQSQSQSQSSLISLHSLDILSGRGKKSYHHKGNVLFRCLISHSAFPYITSSDRIGKGLIVDALYQFVTLKGMRFILDDNGIYTSMTVSKAKDKVSHAIRDCLCGTGLDYPYCDDSAETVMEWTTILDHLVKRHEQQAWRLTHPKRRKRPHSSQQQPPKLLPPTPPQPQLPKLRVKQARIATDSSTVEYCSMKEERKIVQALQCAIDRPDERTMKSPVIMNIVKQWLGQQQQSCGSQTNNHPTKVQINAVE